jgi:type IV secretory pathway VirB4 component
VHDEINNKSHDEIKASINALEKSIESLQDNLNAFVKELDIQKNRKTLLEKKLIELTDNTGNNAALGLVQSGGGEYDEYYF